MEQGGAPLAAALHPAAGMPHRTYTPDQQTQTGLLLTRVGPRLGQLLLESTASDDSAQLGQIETERLLADLVQRDLEP